MKYPIRTGNAVTESKPAEIKRERAPSKTMVVENLNEAMDICGNNLGLLFVNPTVVYLFTGPNN